MSLYIYLYIYLIGLCLHPIIASFLIVKKFDIKNIDGFYHYCIDEDFKYIAIVTYGTIFWPLICLGLAFHVLIFIGVKAALYLNNKKEFK